MTKTALHIVPAHSAEARADALSRQYGEQSALDILDGTINGDFAGDIALVSSFGAESAVLLHLAAQVAPHVPVLFIDTGRHFMQTPVYRRSLAKALGLTNVIDLRPNEDEAAAEDPNNDLWQRDTDACCALRKVRPLDRGLIPYGAWITGRKQFHGGERLSLQVVEHRSEHFKVNPLVRWSPDDIDAYFDKHDLPRHPLVTQGFPSIGCWPCTKPVADGGDVRAGRWSGSKKTECGIHSAR